MEIKELEHNLFKIQFFHQKDKEKFLHRTPWWFDEKVLCLCEITSDKSLSDLKLTQSPFWVRIYDFSFNHCTPHAGKVFGNRIGGFIDWDNSKKGRWGKYVKIAMVDLTKQLKRWAMTKNYLGQPIEVYFKYERLHDFYYTCDRLGHLLHDCVEKDDEADDEKDIQSNFGSWQRATPMRNLQWSYMDKKGSTTIKKMLKLSLSHSLGTITVAS